MNPLVSSPMGADRTALSVNVNKIALLRNSRHLPIPDLVGLARQALLAGAQGITVHPRPDARHIRVDDVGLLAHLLKDFPAAEYNIEGNPTQNLMAFVRGEVLEQLGQQADIVGADVPSIGPGVDGDALGAGLQGLAGQTD